MERWGNHCRASTRRPESRGSHVQGAVGAREGEDRGPLLSAVTEGFPRKRHRARPQSASRSLPGERLQSIQVVKTVCAWHALGAGGGDRGGMKGPVWSSPFSTRQ